MNLYSTLDDLKSALNVSTSTDDARMLMALESASRYVDQLARRYFYTKAETRVMDTVCDTLAVWLDNDLLSASSFKTDSESDGTLDGETWVEGTDFNFWPDNEFPKIEARVAVAGNFAFPKLVERYISIVGVWGYGDGERAVPWDVLAGVTGTVATANGKILTLSADDIVLVGNTIRLGTEDMFVSAVATGNATVDRGVNGSTAATHTTAAISVAKYPPQIVNAAQEFGTQFWRQLGGEVMESEGFGDYRYKRFSNANQRERDSRLVSGFRRPV